MGRRIPGVIHRAGNQVAEVKKRLVERRFHFGGGLADDELAKLIGSGHFKDRDQHAAFAERTDFSDESMS